MKELLKEMLVRDEGLELKPYRDTMGKITIGVGRNLDDVGITRAEAMVMLERDMNIAVDDARSLFPSFDNLSEARQAVLANMAFNLGKRRLSKFIKTRALIEAGDYESAAKEMLNSKWADDVGPRAERLAETMRRG